MPPRRAAAVLLALAAASPAARAQQPVAFPSADATLTGGAPTALDGLLWRPAGPGPFPAIVMLHGCSGMRDRAGRLGARHADWAERFHRLGYVVLHVDSFRPRGVESLCDTPTSARVARASRERPLDAIGALAWLQAQGFVRADRVGLLGWSNGGETTLWTVRVDAAARPPGPDFAAAVAFYPGCRSSRDSGWATRVPLLVLNGDADDWTPAAPCAELARRARAGDGGAVELVIYPGAYHDFDAPGTATRVRTGIATTKSGTATIGTDAEARADSILRVTRWFATRLGP
jgi:dienelactone hydrolase